MTRIPAGELRATREWLGLSTPTLARLLEVRTDTVRRWESGRERVPLRVRVELDALEQTTAAAVDEVVATLRNARHPVVIVYRDTEDLPAWLDIAWLDGVCLGAAWWRHVAASASREVAGTVVCYPDEVGKLPDDTRA